MANVDERYATGAPHGDRRKCCEAQ